jgi:hypothetical protein
MELTFNAELHEYRIDGKVVPSVTEICAPLTACDMGKLNPAVISAAANRGTIIHELTELIDYGTAAEDLELFPDIGGYILAYQRFLRDYNPKWNRIEYRIGSEELGCAGTLDRMGVIDDRPCIVDIKTVASATRPIKVAWVAQLSGYRLLCNGSTFDRYIQQLKPTGKYSLYNAYDIETKYGFWGEDLFKDLLRHHRILKGD